MSQPNLYARVRTFLCTIARETAGAACTRSSLRPRFQERAKRDEKLGRFAPRDPIAMSAALPCVGLETKMRLRELSQAC